MPEWWDSYGPELVAAVVGGLLSALVAAILSWSVGRTLLKHQTRLDEQRDDRLFRRELRLKARQDLLTPIFRSLPEAHTLVKRFARIDAVDVLELSPMRSFVTDALLKSLSDWNRRRDEHDAALTRLRDLAEMISPNPDVPDRRLYAKHVALGAAVTGGAPANPFALPETEMDALATAGAALCEGRDIVQASVFGMPAIPDEDAAPFVELARWLVAESRALREDLVRIRAALLQEITSVPSGD